MRLSRTYSSPVTATSAPPTPLGSLSNRRYGSYTASDAPSEVQQFARPEQFIPAVASWKFHGIRFRLETDTGGQIRLAPVCREAGIIANECPTHHRGWRAHPGVFSSDIRCVW